MQVLRETEGYTGTFSDLVLERNRWVLERVRRTIPPKDVLYDSLSRLFEEFKKPKYDSDDKVPLLFQKARKEFKNLLERHVKKGCFSDPPNVALYLISGWDKYGLTLYRCTRGTSDLESFHQTLEMKFQPWNAGPQFADALLALFRHRYNIRASEKYRPNFPRIGHYDHHLIDEVQEITLRLFGRPVHQWWQQNRLCKVFESSIMNAAPTQIP
jgi:hypothetical protein